MKTHKLVVVDGGLYLNVDTMVLYQYPAGDYDSFRWPLDTTYRDEASQRHQIAMALYDAREWGGIESDTTHVEMPDGSTFPLGE